MLRGGAPLRFLERHVLDVRGHVPGELSKLPVAELPQGPASIYNWFMEQPPTREQMVEYVRRWERLGPLLEKVRDRETRQANTPEAIQMMEQAFRIALRDLPARPSSGLLEWQRWMQLWRRRG